MRRLLLVGVMLAALAPVSTPAVAAARGTPGKGTPAITYVWGQRMTASRIEVVVRVRYGSPAQRVTEQFHVLRPVGRDGRLLR